MTGQDLIDFDHLEKYVSGDVALRTEVLTMFIERAQELSVKLNAAHTDEEWKNATHALKGAARGVGAWALGNLSEEAETLIGPEHAARRSLILDELQSEIDQTIISAKAVCEAA